MTESLNELENRPQSNRRRGQPSNGAARIDFRLPLAEAYCRKIARGHYENFIVASVLLPATMRQPFYNVYAFCRYADDLADESGSAAIAEERLAGWQIELDRCFAGRAEHPITVALADTAARLGIEQAPFDDLLKAFRQDQIKTRYADWDELMQYCSWSANPVGRIVLRMADADTPENIVLSDSVCTGLQLANHWQDIGRDWRLGRLYLPQDAIAAAGVEEAMLTAPRANEAVKRLVESECRRARRLLIEGLPLADRVPKWLAADIRLFIHGGLATLDAIAAIGYDTLMYRPRVSYRKRLTLTLKAVTGRL